MSNSSYCCNLPLLIFLLSLINNFKFSQSHPDPTYGFIPVALTQANFKLQKPYDVPLEQRYSFQNGTHKLWVYADDKPHNPGSLTQPRTEIRIHVRIVYTLLQTLTSFFYHIYSLIFKITINYGLIYCYLGILTNIIMYNWWLKSYNLIVKL